MSKNKKRKFSIGDIIKYFFFVLSVCAVPIYFYIRPTTPRTTIYCNEADECLTYNNNILTVYEREWIRKDSKKAKDARYHEISSCKVTEDLKNDCNLNIKEMTKRKILIQKKNIIEHYYDIKYNYTTIDSTPTLLERAYQNGKNEIYFLNSKQMIISSEEGYQRKYKYTITFYNDDYATIHLNNTPAYTYNVKTHEILGYQETAKNELQYIKFDYYDEKGNILMKDDYIISGSYYLEKEDTKTELYIYQNKVLVGTNEKIEQKELKVIDVNDYDVYYSYGGKTALFSYNLNRKQLRSETNEEKVTETSMDKLIYINFDFYNEDTTFKPIDVPYEGAYRYEEEISVKELLIKDGKIILSEYYPRNKDYKKQEEYTYSPRFRTDQEIEFTYKEGEMFKYNIEKQVIYIYELEYVKIDEKDLKHIELE